MFNRKDIEKELLKSLEKANQTIGKLKAENEYIILESNRIREKNAELKEKNKKLINSAEREQEKLKTIIKKQTSLVGYIFGIDISPLVDIENNDSFLNSELVNMLELHLNKTTQQKLGELQETLETRKDLSEEDIQKYNYLLQKLKTIIHTECKL